ncbi:MAG: glycosyl hydrolase family 28 protein [Lentisphaeria bacterium]|nr:glycosyl hydrolase family 28 protein [Lentisphaeria bacterium]
MIYDVRTYGAKGDGQTKDHHAIQAAIDDCSRQGGGVVCLDAGTFLAGTIYLKDHVCLDIQPGAVLQASPDIADYNTPDFCPQNWSSVIEKTNGAHLVAAVEVHHVTLRGGGRIDGNRAAFFDPYACTRADFPGTRPAQMLFFCESRNIRVENLELTNSPYWTCFLHGCEDAALHGLTIVNDMKAWNSDGLDLDACRRVTVSDCNITGADDAIAIRGNPRRLKDPTRVCEDIAVSNCILMTNQAAVRLGVGNGSIRRCCLSNLCIRGAGVGIDILSTYRDSSQSDRSVRPRDYPDGNAGTEVSDVLVDNVFMQARMPFDLVANHHEAPQHHSSRLLRNITIRGVRGYGGMTSLFQGNHDLNLRHLSLTDIDLEYSGGEQIRLLQDGENCTHRFAGHRPYGMYLANIDGVQLNRVRLAWGDLKGPWSHGLLTANVKNLTLRDCDFPAPPGGIGIEHLDAWNDRL